ncbi:B3 domain-containing transcription factor VRN1-like isoform X2 [Salvia splendens]|uniref:B3 domain-containing transcription factor VRN1-like isoform X2 n=1 Tax=Salvia splendens TaxID=180675 RepID=UPI001C2731FD|nr:B3 domain-containing transcription factor VRN1-like isoform X2 [Salvia splendens]
MATDRRFVLDGAGTGSLLHHNPPFVKIYRRIQSLERMRIPPEWVKRHGRGLPSNCYLVMPNGRRWSVRLLIVANGCYFRTGWGAFVDENRFENAYVLFFTHVGGGVFQVVRCDSMTGCPPCMITMLRKYNFQFTFNTSLNLLIC